MKKILSVFLALITVLSLGMTQVAFAAESFPTQDSIIAETDNSSEIQPRGSLSGYGSTWYSAGSATTGSFTVKVTGTSWVTAQTTLKIESFDSSTCVQLWLYNPKGACVYDTLSWSGGYLTMSQPEVKDTFATGMTGTYTVRWNVFKMDGSAPSSGRIMCWIY